jgi:hypothetical protein
MVAPSRQELFNKRWERHGSGSTAHQFFPPHSLHHQQQNLWLVGVELLLEVVALVRLNSALGSVATLINHWWSGTNPPTPVLPCLDPREETPSLLG